MLASVTWEPDPNATRALVRDGFPGQRMLVLPRPLVRAALERPTTRELLVTDCGYFPHADRHGRTRQTTIDQAILLICVRGRGWCETRGGRFEVEPGQAVFLPPRTPHVYGADEHDPWTLWWMHVAGRAVDDLVHSVGATDVAPVRVPADPSGIALLAAEVVSRAERDTTEASLVGAAGAAWHLLAMLGSSRGPTSDTVELVDRAAEHLRKNINARIAVGELASSVGLSTSHFASQFRKRMGVPVNQYQAQLRMSRARELLVTTSRSVADIAAEIGYDDAFYFARQFRKVHGVSPSGYRQQQHQ